MSPRRSAIALLVASVALGGNVACSSEAQRPETVCGGLIPGQAVVEATGTDKIKVRLKERNFGGDPLLVCTVIFEDVSGLPYSLAITLSTLGYEFRNNRIPKKDDEKPVVENGERVRIGIGRGTLSAKQAWVYATCDDTEYAVDVSVNGETPGSRKAVRAIVAAVLDALKKHKKDCEAPETKSRSPSAA